ncbi:hypothetical protein BDZ97DRAFT_1930232 [Flammula alnicola]|nr:hypothetical protein BDZ97DRAFT_1930232 [Flammula alnicola]
MASPATFRPIPTAFLDALAGALYFSEYTLEQSPLNINDFAREVFHAGLLCEPILVLHLTPDPDARFLDLLKQLVHLHSLIPSNFANAGSISTTCRIWTVVDDFHKAQKFNRKIRYSYFYWAKGWKLDIKFRKLVQAQQQPSCCCCVDLVIVIVHERGCHCVYRRRAAPSSLWYPSSSSIRAAAAGPTSLPSSHSSSSSGRTAAARPSSPSPYPYTSGSSGRAVVGGPASLPSSYTSSNSGRTAAAPTSSPSSYPSSSSGRAAAVVVVKSSSSRRAAAAPTSLPSPYPSGSSGSAAGAAPALSSSYWLRIRAAAVVLPPLLHLAVVGASEQQPSYCCCCCCCFHPVVAVSSCPSSQRNKERDDDHSTVVVISSFCLWIGLTSSETSSTSKAEDAETRTACPSQWNRFRLTPKCDQPWLNAALDSICTYRLAAAAPFCNTNPQLLSPRTPTCSTSTPPYVAPRMNRPPSHQDPIDTLLPNQRQRRRVPFEVSGAGGVRDRRTRGETLVEGDPPGAQRIESYDSIRFLLFLSPSPTYPIHRQNDEMTTTVEWSSSFSDTATATPTYDNDEGAAAAAGVLLLLLLVYGYDYDDDGGTATATRSPLCSYTNTTTMRRAEQQQRDRRCWSDTAPTTGEHGQQHDPAAAPIRMQ